MSLLLRLTLLNEKQTNIKICTPPRENLFLCLLQSHLAALACFHKELERATVNHLEDEHKNHIDYGPLLLVQQLKLGNVLTSHRLRLV